MENVYSGARRSVFPCRASAWHGLAMALLLSLSVPLSADPFTTERTVIQLAQNWHEQMKLVAENEGLTGFCSNNADRQVIYNLLNEIHYYHDLLEADLESTAYDHSSRTIRRILKEIDKLSTEYHPEDFAEFFREQCWQRSSTERKSKIYNTGFGTHSYGGSVYVQETIMEWYLKRLSKRISRVKKHVEHFYAKRLAAEHSVELVRKAT